jgi:hypothetical protein
MAGSAGRNAKTIAAKSAMRHDCASFIPFSSERMPLRQFACSRKDALSLLNKRAKIRSSRVHDLCPEACPERAAGDSFGAALCDLTF